MNYLVLTGPEAFRYGAASVARAIQVILKNDPTTSTKATKGILPILAVQSTHADLAGGGNV